MAYDMQAHGEQIRHAQIAEQDAQEEREYLAYGNAPITLAEMDGEDLLDMIQNDAALDARLVILIERVAMMGLPANNSYYADDALRACHDLHRALLKRVREQAVKDCRK